MAATVGFNVEGQGVSDSSRNSFTEEITYTNTPVSAVAKQFGKPIYIKPKHFDTHDKKVGNEWVDLNSSENRLYTSFVDECQYSGKGRLIKAFPTFLFCILDDQCQWYDGRKLWTNYYVYKPVIDIQYHASDDMPTETAIITVTNTFHNLDRESASLKGYSIKDDQTYSWITRKLYKNFNIIPGGVKITPRLIQLHSILFNHTSFREGARVHLRIGYGSDPMSLAPVINGTVSGLAMGDSINITITSDGHELIQGITSSKKKDINNGFLGTGIGSQQEASNIIASIMTKRQSWMNHLFFAKKWYEGSKYHIEHYGLYINSGKQYSFQGGIDTGIYEQYDLLMNIYHAYTATANGLFIKHKNHLPYMYQPDHFLTNIDGEQNITFNKYNMTPWDVFQVCAQTAPEYIVKSDIYQFDSRLYFGLPFELLKYRYDIINGSIYQEVKSSTQMHYIDSISNIIDNEISVNGKNTNTNVKVMYVRGKTPTSTPLIQSDDTIDHSKQSTHIIDSPIAQDYWGLDALNESIGIKQGRRSARRLGVSNLLYGWEQQYNGVIICLGSPQIRAHDYVMITDLYTSMNGIAIVREVMHSFNTNTGFTTSITPGIIGLSPERESGNAEMFADFFMLYNKFAMCTLFKKKLIDDYYYGLSIISNLDYAIKNNNILNKALKAGNIAYDVIDTGIQLKIAYSMFQVLRECHSLKFLKYVAQFVGNYARTRTVLKTAFRTFGLTVRAISALQHLTEIKKAFDAGADVVAASSGAATFGIGTAITLLIQLVIDALINSLIEWLSNRNVCVLIPLWWEGKPYICSIKDGEKILLFKDTANATDENTGEDGIETDQDEIALNGE